MSIFFTQPASALERVGDGGFDAAVCGANNCASPSWTQDGGFYFGPICNGGVPHCGEDGSGYVTVPNWARLGFGVTSPQVQFIQQQVAIPAAPATLRFALHILNLPSTQGSLSVKLDGTLVMIATDGTAGFYPTYAPVTVDVDRFAGAGTHTLRFEGETNIRTGMGNSDSFDVDEVSLEAPDRGSPGAGSGRPGSCAGKDATISGTNSAETLRGTDGKDVVQAFGGNDLVKGGAGNDLICGGAGKDKLFGNAGRDTLKGGAKKDTCNGGAGNDKSSGCEKGPDS